MKEQIWCLKWRNFISFHTYYHEQENGVNVTCGARVKSRSFEQTWQIVISRLFVTTQTNQGYHNLNTYLIISHMLECYNFHTISSFSQMQRSIQFIFFLDSVRLLLAEIKLGRLIHRIQTEFLRLLKFRFHTQRKKYFENFLSAIVASNRDQ